jgi:uncharacterized protein (DUF433 family)
MEENVQRAVVHLARQGTAQFVAAPGNKTTKGERTSAPSVHRIGQPGTNRASTPGPHIVPEPSNVGRAADPGATWAAWRAGRQVREDAAGYYQGMPWSDRIVIDPEIAAGKPVIRGTRLAVEFILDLLAAGQSAADILANYPGLTHDDILACLACARE